MNEQLKQLETLINSANRILITAHIGPDGDSVSSTLLLYKILKLNFPGKDILATMEEQILGLGFLKDIDSISIGPLAKTLSAHKPDLMIILDANTVSRITRQPEEVRQLIKDLAPKLAIIDHHEPVGIEQNDLYINNSSPAVTLDIFEIFIEKLALKKPDGYAQIAITGIYTDTGGFVNRNLNYFKTFEVVPKLIEDGANIEQVANDLSRLSEAGLEIFKRFINNLQLKDGYAYTYLEDELLSKDTNNIEAIKQAADLIRGGFLRNVGSRQWGFTVYRDVLAPRKTYSVSFRAISDAKDVSEIARKLGGGGHKPAAGAKIETETLENAIEAVLQAIGA